MPIDIASLPYRPCVGLMVFDRARRVWIGRRVGSPNQDVPGGWWQMPQGGIDEGEAPRAAALRELGEETGMRSARIVAESAHWHPYDLPLELLARVWQGRFRGQSQKWFALEFTGDQSEIDISARDGNAAEFDQWRWAGVDELLGLIVPFKRAVYEQVIAEFRHLAG